MEMIEAEVLCPECGMLHDRVLDVQDETWLIAVDSCPNLT